MKGEVRVRFAPSPTGYLHVGNARTALFNRLYSRKSGGSMVLRIEDTDFERSEKRYEEAIIRDLKWLGIDWEEGPDVGGDFGPYRQSERLHIYGDIVDKLVASGRAYRCYCTQDELDARKREQLAAGIMPHYDGRCRRLTGDQAARFKREGRRHVVRFMLPERENVTVRDLVHGEVIFDLHSLGGDFVMVRSDGIPAYNFVVVVDDHLMNISHVIRGEDHLSNTPKQLLLYEALGWPPPAYAHISMVLGPDRAKLGKRHGITSVDRFREEGYLPEALVNHIALLGWYPEDGREIMETEKLVEKFSLERVSTSPSVFDFGKLKWMNSAYIRKKDVRELASLLRPFLERAEEVGEEMMELMADAVRDNIETLADVRRYEDIFVSEIPHFEEMSEKVLREGREVVASCLEVMESSSAEREFKTIAAELKKRTGKRGKELFLPVRVAVTGRVEGPDLGKCFKAIGREKVLLRLRKALSVARAKGEGLKAKGEREKKF